MNKEVDLSSVLETQDNLWGKLCGRSGIDKRRCQARKGHLPTGLSLSELRGNFERFASILGDFAPRVLLISNPGNPGTLIPEQIAVAGGWCAFRTKDVLELSQRGIIMNPENGAIEEVKSVDQVAKWTRRAVAFDQIIEAVGTVAAPEFVVVSERRLWTQRLATKLSTIFGQNLTSQEMSILEAAIEEAEKIRTEMTLRYLKLATGNQSLEFRRVVDADIWDELERAQKELFLQAGITLDDLQNKFPEERETIKSSAMVWAMYSEPYFDTLRRTGFLTRPLVFIVEPSLHTYADTRAGNEVVENIYQSKGIYFDPKGINKNTGFVAFMECVSQNGQSVRKHLGVAEVPNISNWQSLLEPGETLDANRNATINPRDNLLFLWGVNLLPFGNTRQSLLELTRIQEEFQEEKARLNSTFSPNVLKRDPAARISIQNKTAELKTEFLQRVLAENEKIALNLRWLFTYLTKGLVK